MGYRETIEKLCEAGLHPGKTIMATKKETGKELVGVFPIHTPDEIIYAAGCVPVGMWGGKTEIQLADKYLQSFCCSIMRTNVEYAMRGSYDMLKAVVIPTFCDTLKCIVENMKLAMPKVPTIAMAYPQHRKLKAGMEYTISELQRVRRELEKALKTIITEDSIEEAFAVYEDYRATMREFVEEAAKHPEIITAKKRHLLIKAGEYMDKAIYTKEMKEIVEGLKAEGESAFKGTKVIVTGLLSEPVEALEVFDENNVAIVGDDLSMGSRKWRTPAREDVDDVFMKMAYRIADQEGDTFLYEPDKRKGQMMIDMVKEKGADAVVVMMMKFCDPEEYDYPIYKAELAEAGIPELYLEIDQQLATFEQIRTRVQSFTEMLL
ncbi:MAG: 2-hydroxyacyl-CoA dehydratase [Firmicutes bacterium]|jgi:benzoyl-CoA reductase/2-hydroxyglutaryl-CoA dehydratase subunit BcrC/BadD/HgdB|nr:2-hydroxyacyl-CoA dehydratase [Bacillota bacterium]